ncbi:TAXI family TRAP transporter solute-binding subunit [Dethiosulfatarculus sandiegensis]|uniref:TRAP transporter solute receptor n=1 Tax=Dethiosulfatarculus sandiegensis TaxID=1429043 RepID=A0A0D2JCU9_9BACT|nr:TAXI family TRAP transporter solute-binding subunit [Dethiosulfatarculus sandiegensis]KIX13581.1 TRAP transporter solute receptor [Dethiosulfatarculus sandiegensis]
MKKLIVLTAAALIVAAMATQGLAETRIALKSARQASTYYAFSVGVANGIMKGAPDVKVTVESSPGSMVNVKESRKRSNYIFTSPPILIKSALAGKGKFKEGGYDQIRSLWPLPGLVMHWVVTEQSGVKTLQDLAGKKFIPGGAGTAGARFTKGILKAEGILDKVDLITVDLGEGVQAVKNRRAVGFSTSSSPPAALVTEISATLPIRLLELSDETYAKVSKKFARYVIPAGTYKGVDKDTKTISLLVGVYTKADMPEDVVYNITKSFWENRPVWEKAHPAMALLKMEGVNSLGAKLHPGALKYYKEIGFKLDDAVK